MTNKARGEVTIKGPEGKEFTLCLTLGAMAELEDALGIEDITAIGERFEKPKIKDLITILIALLHGGGHPEFKGPADFMDWPMDTEEISRSIRTAFRAAGLDDEEDEDKPAKN